MKKWICCLLTALMLMGIFAGCDEGMVTITTTQPEEKVWNHGEQAADFLTQYFNATTVEALMPLMAEDTPQSQLQTTAASFAETKEMIGLDRYAVEEVRYVVTEGGFDIFLCKVVAMYQQSKLTDYELGTFITLLTREGDRYIMPYVENDQTAQALYARYVACNCNMGKTIYCQACHYLLGEETGGICDLCLSEGVEDPGPECPKCQGKGYTEE